MVRPIWCCSGRPYWVWHSLLQGFGRQQGRTIDFFAVAKAVLHLVTECSVVVEACTGRHKPVRLELRGQQQRPWVKVLKVPKAFPKERPVGPSAEGPSWDELTREMAVDPPSGKEDLQGVYERWAGLAETELLGLYHVDPREHHVDPREQDKYRGREGQPRLVWKRMDKVKSSAYPKTSAEGNGWRWVSDRLEDLADLQLAGAARTLEARTHLLASLRKWRPRGWRSEGQPEQVASEQEVADFRNKGLHGVMEVVSWTRELAVKAHSKFRTAADKAWREWVSKACLGGGRSCS